MISAREAALNALDAITRDDAYTTLALKNHLPNALPPSDKAFASRLVRTTLENLLRIDFALNSFIKSARGSVRNILRLGACQLLYMDTKGYAAVSESVALAKKRKPHAAGFVNATLRALERGKDGIAYPRAQNAQSLSIAASYPLWICEKYVADFGYSFAEALLTTRAPEGTHVRRNPLKMDKDAFENGLLEQGLAFDHGDLDDAYRISGFSDIENSLPYREGWLAVQSLSAMRAMQAIGFTQGDRLLDCCAAPGGKSAYAAALAQGKLDITAWDIHPHRVEMMKKNFRRLGVRAHAQVRDALVGDSSHFESFDIVLLDAPCTAMGLMAHSPDIRYKRKPEDITELVSLQKALIAVCSAYVKKGGILAYMTCSINKEENEGVVDAFLSTAPNFSLRETPVTLYPHQCGSDGFFYAIMRKR